MLFVAFDYTNSRNYIDLANLMFVQMAVKQVSANIIEYLMPIAQSKWKLDKHNEEYKDVIEQYKETGEGPNLNLQKTIKINSVKKSSRFISLPGTSGAENRNN